MTITHCQFPFTAVSGQEVFKLALILSAINPNIGGVLVSGPRGSAKSTLARGLADLMSLQEKQMHPFVTLPLGATEEMLVGSLNLEQVLNEQQLVFKEGLLGKANGGVLYVDEVNLLADNLVDLLLDVAASGVNIVERDGISQQHSAEFILLGTMNPDEGELRSQLQDRFGLMVELDSQYSIDERMDIVRLREAFDNNPQVFLQTYQTQQQQLAERIQQAKDQLAHVNLDDKWRRVIAERCHAAQVDGVRADIVWYRAALAHAAWKQRTEVIEEDIAAVEELVLAHRRQVTSQTPPPPPPFKRPTETHENNAQSAEGDWGQMEPEQQKAIHIEPLALLAHSTNIKKDSVKKNSSYSLAAKKTKGLQSTGGKSKATNQQRINWFTTLIANIESWSSTKLIKSLRFHKTNRGQATLNLVLLDTSASTLSHGLQASAKGAVLQIANNAYLRREQLTILGFGNQQVDVLLNQQRSPKALEEWINKVSAAGGTPLREVIDHALVLQQKQYPINPAININTYLITDGRTSQPLEGISLLGHVMVIDIEQSLVKRGKAQQIAQQLSANYFALPA